jgi:hypothetical protein
VPIALGDLVGAFQLLVVLVLYAERLADIVDAILIRRRIVAARRFVADGVRILPVRIDVASRQIGADLVVFAARLL